LQGLFLEIKEPVCHRPAGNPVDIPDDKILADGKDGKEAEEVPKLRQLRLV
jgi:hypothetical protein